MRFPEGTVHGFLVIRSTAGTALGHGHLLQAVRADTVESRMVLRWDDGSSFDERVTFSQNRVFTMRRYQLIQRGPAFPRDMEVVLERSSGRYVVTSRDHDDGEQKREEGRLELPPDLYNGMVILITKNLSGDRPVTVHFAAFTPEPRIIELEIAPAAGQSVTLHGHPQKTFHYTLKPRLGLFLGALATLAGRTPSDGHVWIVTEHVPAFVRFEGTLSVDGPVQRIDLTAPIWPDAK